MAILNQVCANWSDLSRQLDQFKMELRAIEIDVNKQVSDIINSKDAKDVDTSATKALEEANNFFATQGSSLESVTRNSGISASTPEAPLESLGYVYANSRYWLCNTTSNATKYAPPEDYGYVGIGAGEYDEQQIAALLGREYVDPDPDSISSMLQQATNTPPESPAPQQSITGSRHGSGNIADLRELYRGCGSTLETLNSFLHDSYMAGFGVLWSTSHVVFVPKPQAFTDDEFNSSYIRRQVNAVVYEDDMLFRDDMCFVRIENYVGHNTSRESALNTLRRLSIELGVSELPLIARTITFNPNEDIHDTSPLITSRGCDASKLNTTTNLLGLAVNGIYRVIDVTGDRGQHIVRDSYGASDIADSITEVFGDLVETGTVGSEFFVKLKVGFGATGTLSLFHVGSEDCSDVVGLQAAIDESAQASAQVLGGSAASIKLSSVGEVTWSGGVSLVSETPSSYMLDFLSSDSLPRALTTSLVTKTNYWEAIQNDLESIQSEMAAGCDTNQNQRLAAGIMACESMFSYYDASAFKYREYKTMRSALGTSLHDILVHKTDVLSLDVYTSKKAVNASLTAMLNDILGSDGIVPSVSSPMLISYPLSLNYAMASRLRLLYSVSTQYSYIDEAMAAQSKSELCSYVSALGVATTNQIEKSEIGSFAKIMDGMDALNRSIGMFSGDDLNRVIWNVLKDTPGISSLFDAGEFAQRKLDDAAGFVDSGIRSIEDAISDIVDALGLDAANRAVITALMQVELALDTAIAIAQRITTLYNTTTQKIITLSNFNLNMSGSLGFQTKYLSCYASGGISAMPLQFLAKMLATLNDIADKMNKRLSDTKKVANSAIDKIICLLDKLVLSLTGTMMYESTMQVGMVSMKFQCTSYVNLGTQFDPKVLQHIMDIRRKINFLLACMRVQAVTFQKHEENMDAASSVFTGSLEDTVNEILGRFSKCF